MKANYKMTQMERIEHRKMIEKDAKNNVQELLLGNDWLKNGGYTHQVENYKKMLVIMN